MMRKTILEWVIPLTVPRRLPQPKIGRVTTTINYEERDRKSENTSYTAHINEHSVFGHVSTDLNSYQNTSGRIELEGFIQVKDDILAKDDYLRKSIKKTERENIKTDEKSY